MNCWDYEDDGKECVSKGTCRNIACNGGTCGSDGSCEDCPRLASGRFCHVSPDCTDFELGGADSDCFDSETCTNVGCANGGTCQRDGSCLCPLPERNRLRDDLDEGKDPFSDFEDDDNISPTDTDPSSIRYSGKLCQIKHKQQDQEEEETTNTKDIGEGNAPPLVVECESTACESNGGQCGSDGTCVCPEGLTGDNCEQVLDCWENEIGGQDCVSLGTCSDNACHILNNTSTCQENGQCKCPESYDQEVYGKLCHKVRPIDDCFVAEDDGEDCFKLGTCSDVGCSNGGTCMEDGSCDCPSLFWGKTCQHARDCFEQEYSCFFNTFLTGGGTDPNSTVSNQEDSPCSDSGCLNNGICQASGTCLCPDGYDGKICHEALP